MPTGDILDKIGKLLAQAEAKGTTPEEAVAFTERAQAIATTYAVDLEMARYAQKSKEQREVPTSERVVVGVMGRKFANRWWVDLMDRVCDVNDVRWTVSHDRAVMWLYGYPSDLAVCQLLFASLNTQMVGGVAANMKAGVHKTLGIHGATYRLNFYQGFIYTIGSRLHSSRRAALLEQRERDANAAALRSAETPDDATPVLTGALVMQRKQDVVGEFYDKNNGVTSKRTYRAIQPKTLSRAATADGATAAKNARLSTPKTLPGSRVALG